MGLRRQMRGGPLDGYEATFSNPEVRVQLTTADAALVALYRWDQEDNRYLYVKTVERGYEPKGTRVATLNCQPRPYGTLVDCTGFRMELTLWSVLEGES